MFACLRAYAHVYPFRMHICMLSLCIVVLAFKYAWICVCKYIDTAWYMHNAHVPASVHAYVYLCIYAYCMYMCVDFSVHMSLRTSAHTIYALCMDLHICMCVSECLGLHVDVKHTHASSWVCKITWQKHAHYMKIKWTCEHVQSHVYLDVRNLTKCQPCTTGLFMVNKHLK